MADRTAVDVRVHGRVQGVGFRYNTRITARRLDVDGWVRNERDGSVSVHAEGSADSVRQLVSWLREGPPGARVTSVDERPGTDTGCSGFSVRF